jgi:putative tryptophan/tyrosine transport system substrate-binding protein
MQFDRLKRREFITLAGGAIAAWPLAARGQPMPVIGFMSSRSPEDSANGLAAFRKGLSESGLIEGKNLAIEFRWARGAYDRLPALAAELVSNKVTVLVTAGGDPSAQAGKAATSTIPIVFISADPMKSGLVASLNRPGGNATGVYFPTEELEPKRLGLLHEHFPHVTLFGALINPKRQTSADQALELTEAVRKISRPVVILTASTDAELEAAFATLAQQRVAAMVVAADPFFDTRRDRIIALAAQHKLPALYHSREYVMEGGLMSYGVSFSEAYRWLGIYASKVLLGTKPAELPVMQSVKFELVINMKTAKALAFAVPDKLLALADEVVE